MTTATLIQRLIEARASPSADPPILLPTLICPVPRQLIGRDRPKGFTAADTAIHAMQRQGFVADRTRMGLGGYPERLRQLQSAAPWIEVTPDDVELPLSDDRAAELQASYHLATATHSHELLRLAA
jgi:hypothetical protein